MVAGGHLEAVLGVFQKLLASRAHDHEGFFLLNSLMEFLPLDVFRGYLPTVWTLLFRRSVGSRRIPDVLLFRVLAANVPLHSWMLPLTSHLEGNGRNGSGRDPACADGDCMTKDAWKPALRRLQSAPTTKYSRGLVVFIAFFVCKHGGGTVLDSIDALQPQPPLSAQILDSVWAPTLPQVPALILPRSCFPAAACVCRP